MDLNLSLCLPGRWAMKTIDSMFKRWYLATSKERRLLFTIIDKQTRHLPLIRYGFFFRLRFCYDFSLFKSVILVPYWNFFFPFFVFFGQVFGPKSQQRSIYEHAVSPIVNDVLEGFNCTIFAYGQTGTGKTYTMEGKVHVQLVSFTYCTWQNLV